MKTADLWNVRLLSAAASDRSTVGLKRARVPLLLGGGLAALSCLYRPLASIFGKPVIVSPTVSAC